MKAKNQVETNLKSFIFYEPFNQIITRMDDETAGKFALRICKFMFEGELDKSDMDESEDFVFTAIEDMLINSKVRQQSGREQRGYKSKFKHFTFYELYYKAMKILSLEDSGKFVKSLWKYLFDNEKPCFESSELNYYFSLCEDKLDLSKKRQTARKKNSRSMAISRLTALNDNKNNSVIGVDYSLEEAK